MPEQVTKSSVARSILIAVGLALVVLEVLTVGFNVVAERREIDSSAERRALAALDMLEALNTQAMLNRGQTQDGDPAIATLDGAMDQFSRSHKDIRLWVSMGPKVLAYQHAKGQKDVEAAHDRIDQEAIVSARPQRATLDGWQRVTLPVVMGKGNASSARCASCHNGQMGIQKGEVIGAYSAAVDLAPLLAAWHSSVVHKTAASLIEIIIVLGVLAALLHVTTLRPLQYLISATRHIASGHLDTEVAHKERGDELGTLARSLEVFRTNLLQKQKTERKIAHMARHDGLTGLPNRANLNEHLDVAMKADSKSERKIAVISMDLDQLEAINDMHGHAAGDELLKGVSRRVIDALVEGELFARVGGDEFAAVKQFDTSAALGEFVTRLENCLFATQVIDGSEVHIGGHMGVAVWPDDTQTKDGLITAADIAMHRAKTSLNQITCFYDAAMDEAARSRGRLVNDLRSAIARKELAIVYQVQTSIRTSAITGYEALLRWHHSDRGMISPADFIPLAEESGTIVPIGEWVLRTACSEAVRWPQPYKIAVNLSSVQLIDPRLAELVHDILLETGLPPERLELEITESAIIHDKAQALSSLRQIKELGVTIALDDFGTGYSSLDTLKSFPFDKIKLDRSFIAELEESGQAKAIVRAIVALGHSLGIPVLAEGVETREQLELLKIEQCDEVQGYLFGRPQAGPAFAAEGVA